MDDEPDDVEEAMQEAWVGDLRRRIDQFFKKDGTERGEIGEWPSWCVAPYFAVFAVESAVNPGGMGWWAVCGDVPTAQVPFSDEIDDPRKATRHFGQKWLGLSESLLKGEPHPEIEMGSTQDWPELGKQLQSRAQLLLQWAEDESLWEEEEL